MDVQWNELEQEAEIEEALILAGIIKSKEENRKGINVWKEKKTKLKKRNNLDRKDGHATK